MEIDKLLGSLTTMKSGFFHAFLPAHSFLQLVVAFEAVGCYLQSLQDSRMFG